jgi:hypothetical protein
VARHTSKTKLGRGWFAGLAAAPLSMILAGCAPEGAGTVKVGNPAEVRAKQEGGGTPAQPKTAKQAKALQVEEEAAKKNPKLR